jgi:hypothetical protein
MKVDIIKNKVTSKCELNSGEVVLKIYINKTLHIRIPLKHDIIYQSWVDHGKYCIELQFTDGRTEHYWYGNKELSSAIINEFDKYL